MSYPAGEAVPIVNGSTPRHSKSLRYRTGVVAISSWERCGRQSGNSKSNGKHFKNNSAMNPPAVLWDVDFDFFLDSECTVLEDRNKDYWLRLEMLLDAHRSAPRTPVAHHRECPSAWRGRWAAGVEGRRSPGSRRYPVSPSKRSLDKQYPIGYVALCA